MQKGFPIPSQTGGVGSVISFPAGSETVSTLNKQSNFA